MNMMIRTPKLYFSINLSGVQKVSPVIHVATHVMCLSDLTDFLHRFDERYDERVKKDGTIMAKKQRKLGVQLIPNHL